MTDFLTVKAKRTFSHGKELKTKRSDPFDVEAGEARQLESLGYVEIVGKVEKVDEPETHAETPVITGERKPRKAKANADD
ncbi:hypothetical protein [Devosia elaeis]|uniref:Uncharacterized protein n=1 Tax=Devosia elaeis TaxID=1770058 RepID=A0A178I062_9HYPH|nr:hypothetical protein [Devosia elaeis]OAM77704.1 hypothetical protein A3840_08720 [Devosia elaeis]